LWLLSIVPVGGGGSAARRVALRIGFVAAFERCLVAAFLFGAFLFGAALLAPFFFVAAFFFVAFFLVAFFFVAFFAIRRAPLLSDVFALTT
jgi:hypothetical protein